MLNKLMNKFIRSNYIMILSCAAFFIGSTHVNADAFYGFLEPGEVGFILTTKSDRRVTIGVDLITIVSQPLGTEFVPIHFKHDANGTPPDERFEFYMDGFTDGILTSQTPSIESQYTSFDSHTFRVIPGTELGVKLNANTVTWFNDGTSIGSSV